MLKKIKEFFLGKPVVAAPVDTWQPKESAPYKLPEPAVTTPIPLVVTNSNPADNVPVAESAPAPVQDQLAVVNAAEGSAVTAAPEKKTRKPRTPKTETIAKEKAPAKAKAPKLTVVKSEKKSKSKKA